MLSGSTIAAATSPCAIATPSMPPRWAPTGQGDDEGREPADLDPDQGAGAPDSDEEVVAEFEHHPQRAEQRQPLQCDDGGQPLARRRGSRPAASPGASRTPPSTASPAASVRLWENASLQRRRSSARREKAGSETWRIDIESRVQGQLAMLKASA